MNALNPVLMPALGALAILALDLLSRVDDGEVAKSLSRIQNRAWRAAPTTALPP